MAAIDLIILDFDGTLVDTAPDLIRSTNFYLESKGFDSLPAERIRQEIGMGLKNLIISVYPDLDPQDDMRKRKIEGEFLAIYEREFLHQPKLFDGALNFLNEWDGRVAIVSNKRSRFIHPILAKLEIHKIPWSAVIGGDTYPNMKPHPEPLLAAMTSAGTTPERTLIVGDGSPDVAGALAVGSRCVAVDFGYTPAEELLNLGAWKKIGHFEDLIPLINSMT